jgi:hypothetical protein
VNNNLLKLGLSALAIVIGIVSLNRDWSRSIRDSLFHQQRTLISTAVGDLLGDGTPVEVAKVKTNDGLLLEVYAPGPQGSRVLLDRINLDQQRDGYFTFNGQLVTLAVDDIDGDHRPEILAPSFDQQLTAHLNVFKYDPLSKSFQKMTTSKL